MFKKVHDAIRRVSTQVLGIDQCLEGLHRRVMRDSEEVDRRLDSIETWMELAVDAKADEVAERFGALLKQTPKPVTSDELKDMVRQAVKGQ